MAGKKHEADGFEEFLAEYNAAETPGSGKHINSSKFTLEQQLNRFSNFSHTEDESKTIDARMKKYDPKNNVSWESIKKEI